MPDPYSILGASPGASDEEIRQRYLALTRRQLELIRKVARGPIAPGPSAPGGSKE